MAKDEPGFLCRDWLARNRAGLNALELSADVLLGHHSADSRQVKVHRLLKCAWRDWQQSIAPLLQRQLESVMQLADLAKISLEYLDGSGRPFEQPQPKSPAAAVPAAAPAVHHSSVPSAAAAQPVVALDAAEVGAEPAPAAAAPAAAAGGNPAAVAIAIDDAEEEDGGNGEDVEEVEEWGEDALGDFVDSDSDGDE